MEHSNCIPIRRTAQEVHESAYDDIYSFYDDDLDDFVEVKRKIPTMEQANAFIEIVNKQRNYMIDTCCGRLEYDFDEGERLSKGVDRFKKMALDMRDVVFSENGKQGLRRANGKLLVPAIFDSIPETYDYIFDFEGDMPFFKSVPVIRDGKYALCEMDGKGTLRTDFIYDNIFRNYSSSINCFVVEQNGKKGILHDYDLEVIVPCEMDEIYAQSDRDGIIPFKKGDKWGMLQFDTSTEAIFDEIEIRNEQPARGKIGDEWFYVDCWGEPTKVKDEFYFTSRFDREK